MNSRDYLNDLNSWAQMVRETAGISPQTTENEEEPSLFETQGTYVPASSQGVGITLGPEDIAYNQEENLFGNPASLTDTPPDRSVYIPRQAIVQVANQVAEGIPASEAWGNLFEEYQEMGINRVYFEANPYFAMYESDILEEYPFLNDTSYTGTTMPDWNDDEEGRSSPLESAAIAAGELGIDFYAWNWVAKAHSQAVNPFISEDPSYTGSLVENYPWLSTYTTQRHPDQTFLDLSDGRTRELALDIFREVAEQEGVDGVTLDYARESFSRGNRDPQAITDFVIQADQILEEVNPDARLMGTVFPERYDIAQEWENWPVDEIQIMNYRSNPGEFNRNNEIAQARLNEVGSDVDIVSIIRAYGDDMTPEKFLEILENSGGDHAIFAANHLDERPEIAEVLRDTYFNPFEIETADNGSLCSNSETGSIEPCFDNTDVENLAANANRTSTGFEISASTEELLGDRGSGSNYHILDDSQIPNILSE